MFLSKFVVLILGAAIEPHFTDVAKNLVGGPLDDGEGAVLLLVDLVERLLQSLPLGISRVM